MPAQASSALPPETPVRVFHWVRIALIGLVVVTGVAFTAVEWHQGNEAAKRDDMAVGRRAVDLVQGTAASTQAGLAGATGLVQPDGHVDIQNFVSYGLQVTSNSTLTALAYEPVVTEAGRRAFEAQIGRPIVDHAVDGSFVPAPPRAEHWPVRAIAPTIAANKALFGFDLAGDPVRSKAAAQARDTGRVVFTKPTPSQPSGTMAYFIIKPLYRLGAPTATVTERRAALAGFISSAAIGSDITASLAKSLPAGTRFEVRDGATLLASTKGAPRGGITRPVDIAERRWTIRVEGPAHADHGTAVLLALLTALLAGGLGFVLQRSARHDRELRRSAELMARTADLAASLSSANTVDEVAEVVQEQLSGVLAAPSDAATSIGIIEGDRLKVLHGSTVPAEYRERYTAPLLSAELAFTESARTGATLIFEDQAAYDARFPGADGPKLGARAVLPLRRADGTTMGSMAHLWPRAMTLDPALVSTLQTIAQLTGQALERARLAQVQAEDARHNEGLARLAEGLTMRTNSEAVMTFLTQGVLAPLDAFHAAVAVIEGKQLRRHYSPGGVSDEAAAAGALQEETSLQADSPLAKAARLGEPVLLRDEAALKASYPHLVESWRSVGFGATANLALRDRQGRIIGALGVAWDHPVTFDADLRDRLATVAGIAGQTIDRAQLVDRIRAEARGSEALAELAEVLATARSADEVAAAAVETAPRVVGADGADVVVVDPPTGQMRRDGAPLAPTDPLPHIDVIRDGGTLTFAGLDQVAERYPDLARTLEGRGRHALAVTALRDSSARRVGALGFEWDDPVQLDRLKVSSLRSVAELVSQALERAQLSDAEHRLALTLQGSVLAPLPRASGLELAARYLPAARSVGMGGDWYEGIVLDDDRYLVVVGDVAGHGITAVGQMAQFRAVIGALARLDTKLDELFPLATAVVQGIDPIASAVAAEIDVRAGVVRYSAAGHPPPLLRMPDGEVRVLEGGRQSLLGVAMPGRPAGEHPFPAGATLICYTDGLIERRAEAIDESVRRLALTVGALPLLPGAPVDPQQVADELLRACLPQRDQTDDVAVAVLTRQSAQASARGRDAP
jgi:CHASE1-domain containing sensor protein